MPMLKVVLKDSEQDALLILAEREFRDPRAQAALIIRCELELRGYLPTIGDHTKGGRKDDHKSKPACSRGSGIERVLRIFACPKAPTAGGASKGTN